MINITPTNQKKDDNTRVKSQRKSSRTKQKGESFNETLDKTISFNFQGTIETLLDNLREEEERFLNDQTLYNMERYKAIVKSILKTIINEGFSSKTLKRSRRDRADFTIVKEIDNKLIAISLSITQKTNKAFNLLKATGEIRGLLLNLLY